MEIRSISQSAAISAPQGAPLPSVEPSAKPEEDSSFAARAPEGRNPAPERTREPEPDQESGIDTNQRQQQAAAESTVNAVTAESGRQGPTANAEVTPEQQQAAVEAYAQAERTIEREDRERPTEQERPEARNVVLNVARGDI